MAARLADPERALAISYAPADRRSPLAALFALDERLGSVVGTTTETGLGLIRLAWWREALVALDNGAIPPEPLLAAVARAILPCGIGGAAVAELEAGWTALLDGPIAADDVARFGRRRGGTLFTLAGRLLGSDDPRLAPAGAAWALADLGHRHSDAEVRGWARDQALAALSGVHGGWPRALRPLGALTALARRDAVSDEPRRQGSPGRVARMLVLRLTGR